MLEESVYSFLEKAASRSPAPGGGCIAAAAGAMGAAMASMPANFTIGKKGYEDAREEAEKILAASEASRKKLAELAEEDIASYEKVSAAYKLLADTDELKKEKRERIRESLLLAMKPPFETARECIKVMRLLPRLAAIGNKNLISDVGVSAFMLNAALESAALNVEINLKALGDEALKNEKRTAIDGWLSESRKILEEIGPEVLELIRG